MWYHWSNIKNLIHMSRQTNLSFIFDNGRSKSWIDIGKFTSAAISGLWLFSFGPKQKVLVLSFEVKHSRLYKLR